MRLLPGSSMLIGFLTLATIVGALSGLLSRPQLAPAENWPGWRGDGSGISPEKSLPIEWDAKTNILWKSPVPGEGNSSPIIYAGRINLTATLNAGKTRAVLCYDAADGREIWRQEFTVDKPAPTYPKNGHASHTPVTDGARVYAFFDDPGLVALNSKTGAVDWQLPLGPFKTVGYFAASPILAGDLLIMVCDVDANTLDGKLQKGGFIVAVDKANGRPRWRTPRKPSAHGASPLAIDVGGKTQIVVTGDPVISYDAQTGRELWSCKGMMPMCAPSPVFDGTQVFVTSGRNGPAMAIDPTGTGDVTETHATLLTDSGGPYVPSPLIYPCLILPGDDGKLTFLDKSGQLLLRTRLPGHFSASPLGAEGRVYWPDEKGRTYVLDVSQLTIKDPRAPILAINDVGEPILASPAASNGRLYLRSTAHLYCIAGSAKTIATIAAATQPQAALAQLLERYQKSPASEGPDVALRLEVVSALATLKDPGAVAALLKIVQKEPHWDVCEAAAKALADHGDQATDALLEVLSDGREFLKIIAADALGELQAVKATTKLAANSADKNRFVRLAALRALGRIALAPDADRDLIFPALNAALSVDKESPVKLAAIQALVALADKAGTHRPTIVKELQARTTDPNIVVAKAATVALAKAYKGDVP